MCKEVEKKQHYHIGPRMRRLDNVLKRNMILSLKGQGMDEVTAMNSFFIGYLYSRKGEAVYQRDCLLYTSPSPRDPLLSRMPSSA